MNPQEARKLAQESRARQERSSLSAARTMILEMADVVDALVGEVEERKQDAANLRDLNETMGRNLQHLHGRVAAKSRRVDELEAALPKAWAVLGLVDREKLGGTFVAQELRDALVSLAEKVGRAALSGGNGEA